MSTQGRAGHRSAWQTLMRLGTPARLWFALVRQGYDIRKR